MRRAIVIIALAVAACRGSSAKPVASEKVMTADLDVKQLQKDLGPPIKPPVMPIDHAVRVLEEFAAAGPVTALPKSGEEVWYGRSYSAHADGNAVEGYVFVRLKSDNTGFANPLVPESGAEESNSKGLLKGVMKGAAPENEATKYVRTAPPKGGYHPVVKSDGASTIVGQSYLRQAGNKLLLVERLPTKSSDRATPFKAAGRYAELWKLAP